MLGLGELLQTSSPNHDNYDMERIESEINQRMTNATNWSSRLYALQCNSVSTRMSG